MGRRDVDSSHPRAARGCSSTPAAHRQHTGSTPDPRRPCAGLRDRSPSPGPACTPEPPTTSRRRHRGRTGPPRPWPTRSWRTGGPPRPPPAGPWPGAPRPARPPARPPRPPPRAPPARALAGPPWGAGAPCPRCRSSGRRWWVGLWWHRPGGGGGGGGGAARTPAEFCPEGEKQGAGGGGAECTASGGASAGGVRSLGPGFPPGSRTFSTWDLASYQIVAPAPCFHPPWHRPAFAGADCLRVKNKGRGARAGERDLGKLQVPGLEHLPMHP